MLGALTAFATSIDSGHVQAVITFVGDSNESLTATSIVLTLGNGDQPYANVFLSRPGAAIRTGDCAQGAACATHDFWRHRLADASAQIDSDAYVVDLGINDTLAPGRTTGAGYADYGAKIDWLMPAFGGKPVWWTNLPCSIEPANRFTGCRAVNRALDSATARWKNLVVVDWASAARGHREYLPGGDDGVHLSQVGQGKWSQLVEQALDRRFASG